MTGHGKRGKSYVELSYVKNIYTVYHKQDLVLKLILKEGHEKLEKVMDKIMANYGM